MWQSETDILEDYILKLSPDLFNTLLKDHTTSKADCQCNIFWATSDYEHLGKGYEYKSPILPELIRQYAQTQRHVLPHQGLAKE